MKTMRETFEENYMAVDVPANNRKGFKIKYEYIGNWYVFGNDAEHLRRIKRQVANLTLTSLILYIAAGIQNSPINYSRYVELFAMLSLAAFVFQAVGAVQFCVSGERMTNSSFDDIRAKLTVAPAIYGVLLVIASALGMMEAARGKGDGFAFLIPVCYLLSGLIALSVTYLFKGLPYHVEENRKKNGHGKAGKKRRNREEA